MLAVVEEMPVEGIRALLMQPAVDALLNLDPPLETVLADDPEQLYPEATAVSLEKVRQGRVSSPREAVIALGELLKRIRNKRAHGFKTRKGERDGVILGAARPLLFRLVGLAIQVAGE